MTRWPVVAERESRDLWIGGRGPVLVFGFSLLLSAITYLAATNRAMNFLERREARQPHLPDRLAVGVLVTAVINAGSTANANAEPWSVCSSPRSPGAPS